jgi:hypothetical protein
MSKPWSIVAATSREGTPVGVVESWSAVYQRSPWAGCVPNNVAEAVWAESIRQLLARGAVCQLAVNPAKPDHWLGYLLVEFTRDGLPVVHAMYTKSAYRRSGIQSSLLTAARIDRSARLLYTFRLGPEHKLFPAGKYAPEVARRKAA